MSKSGVDKLCTPENKVRSTYFSDTYRGKLKLGGVVKYWDITHIRIPFVKEKEAELRRKYFMSAARLEEFYVRFSERLAYEHSVLKRLHASGNSQLSANLVRNLYIERNEWENGSGTDYYIITDTMEPLVGSPFINERSTTLLCILQIVARLTQILKLLQGTGVHVGAFDLDTVYLTKTDEKQMMKLGSLLYAEEDGQDVKPRLATIPYSSFDRLRKGKPVKKSVETDLYSIYAILRNVLDGKHYNDKPVDRGTRVKYAADIMAAFEAIDISNGDQSLKEVHNLTYALIKKIKKGERPNDEIIFDGVADEELPVGRPLEGSETAETQSAGKNMALGEAEKASGQEETEAEKSPEFETIRGTTSATEQPRPAGVEWELEDNAVILPQAVLEQAEKAGYEPGMDSEESTIPTENIGAPDVKEIQAVGTENQDEIISKEEAAEPSAKLSTEAEPAQEQKPTSERKIESSEENAPGPGGQKVEKDAEEEQHSKAESVARGNQENPNSGKAHPEGLRGSGRLVLALLVVLVILVSALCVKVFMMTPSQGNTQTNSEPAWTPAPMASRPGQIEGTPAPSESSAVGNMEEKEPVDAQESSAVPDWTGPAEPKYSAEPTVAPAEDPKPAEAQQPRPAPTAELPALPSEPPAIISDSGTDVFSVAPTTATLVVGERLQLRPSDTCTWSSSNPDVAYVTANGLMAAGIGTCTVTARQSETGETVQIVVTVTEE